jgi:hypothetical protein
MQTVRRCSPTVGRKLAARSVGGLALISAGVVAAAPVASATTAVKPKKVVECAIPHSAPFDVKLASVHAEMQGTVSWTCRSVDVVGSLHVAALPKPKRNPATGALPVIKPVTVIGWAGAKSPAFGISKLHFAKSSPFVSAQSGQTVSFNSGYQRPTDAAGRPENVAGAVGTIILEIGYGPAPGQYSTPVVLHQPVFK